METRKLYYEDCHLYSFAAQVISCTQEGKVWQVVLDATAFYPEGGGQAWDLGTLGGAQVLAVRERAGRIFHECSAPLTVGKTVQGTVDKLRRQDLAQQHTGEHIVSGLLHRRFGGQNTGFHVGAQVMEVDFDCLLTPEDVAWLEQEANRVVWENLPVVSWYPSPEELPAVPYRRKRDLNWPVRIVQIGQVDCCACCGVHAGSTGEVGVIKILSCGKFHQGVRLEMVCGGRALRYFSALFAQNRQISQALSAKPLETGAAVLAMKEALAAEKFRAAALEKRVFARIAGDYAGQEVAVCFEEGLSGGGLRELAQAMQAQGVGLAAVFSGQEGDYGFCLLGGAEQAGAVCRALTERFHGRGGGRGGACQGRIPAKKAEILAFFAEK